MRYIIKLLCLFSLINIAWSENISVGFIYKQPPEEAFYLYDWLVVDPDNFSFEKLNEKFYIKNKKSKLFAYVSIGEVEPNRKYYKDIKKDWILGENKDWKTYIIDLRNKDCREFLIRNVLSNLENYDGFFFDTLDSYQLVLKKPEDIKAYEESIISFINQVKSKYPEKKIIINRGFEVVEYVKDKIDAVVAESLLYGLNTKNMTYKKQKEEDTMWLLNQLNKIKQLGINVVVIDYIDPKDKKLQKEVAKKIYQYGFIPYVTDKYLQTLGTSIYQIIPRKILIPYNSSNLDPSYNVVHQNFQVFLEYLGFVPVLVDIKEIPKNYIGDEYAGVIIYLQSNEFSKEILDWIENQIKDGLKIFFLTLPSDENFLLNVLKLKSEGTVSLFEKVDYKNYDYKYFEIKPENFGSIEKIIPLSNYKPVLSMYVSNKEYVPFAITEWGGYAIEKTFLYTELDIARFVFNPVEIFEDVFKPYFPVPDVTTENGRRILTAHIDGDAFFGVADFNPQKNLGEIIRDEILKVYKIPHTISIIEGEISHDGLYPDKSEKLENIARSIFKLENVEPASHSFSHPFNWILLFEDSQHKNNNSHMEGIYNLNIKNYNFSIEREIIGSINYINKNLLPPEKKVKVFLWTGDCVPPKEAIKLTYESSVYNVNGGNTQISSKYPYFSLIAPMGVNKGEYFQIYTPIQNENVYTDLWKDYYGYVKVISTFELTDRPYRFKPMSIYYHFYSGQKINSLEALKKVYNYAISQENNPMFLSEYAQRVLEFRNTVVAKDLDDNFVIRGEGNLKTVRFDSDINIDIFKSEGVLGYKKINNSVYVHLSNEGKAKIILSNETPKFLFVDSNGQIASYKKENNKIYFKLKSYVPLSFKILNKNCKVIINPSNYKIFKNKDNYEYQFKIEKEANVEAYCNS